MFSIDTAKAGQGSAASNRVESARGLEREGRDVLVTGLEALDGVLPDGGLLRGTLSEISGGRSSGKRTLAAAICARTLTERGHAVWIDGVGGFCPLIGLEHGVSSLERLIVVRAPAGSSSGRAARRGVSRERRKATVCLPALRAADILLSAGDALALLVVDLPPGTAVPQRLLSRLRLGVETSGAALLFVTEHEATERGSRGARESLGTFIGLRLHVRRGSAPEAHRLAVTVAKSKRGRMAHRAMVTIDEPHSVCLDTTV